MIRLSLPGLLVAASLVWACGSGAAHSSQSGRAFQTGITGAAPAGRLHPTSALSDPAVRDLILAAADTALPAASARARLAGQAYSLEELVSIGLVAIDRDRVSLAFSYLSAEDQRRIAARARSSGRQLADRILEQRPAIDATINPAAWNASDRQRVLFFLVGCMALDWDGLRVTAADGYRATATVVTPGYAYTPWMKENAPDVSRRGLYWGSHNAAAGAFTFTTFGDHHALPRRALPDLTFRQESPASLPDLAAVLLAVHGGARTPAAIAAAGKLAPPGVTTSTAFLESIGYLERRDGQLTAVVPILTMADAAVVDRVRALVRDEIRGWHTEHYGQLSADLSGVTPRRHGVDFKVVYTEIWHYVFGYANLFLAEAGLIADPYAPGARHQGFLPVVWATALDPAPRS